MSPPPEAAIYRAFTISPTAPPSSPSAPKSWSNPQITESNFPQPSLIAELSAIQEKDGRSIAEKIKYLSRVQSGLVHDVLLRLEEERGKDAGGGGDGQWSVCEAQRVRDVKKGRTRCVRVFFVRAVGVRRGESVVGDVKGKGKEKVQANISRSRSRGTEKEKGADVREKEIPAPAEKIVSSKSPRRETREREREKERRKVAQREEEKNRRRKSTKPRSRKEFVEDDGEDPCSCDECLESTISIRNRSAGRQSKQRSLSSRFRPRQREVEVESHLNPAAFGRTDHWQKPVIIPPPFSTGGGGYQQPTEYHIRAAYEAGQRDALADRLRNATLERHAVPNGPSRVISFERLRPGFEEWSEGSFSRMGQQPEIYVNQRRPPVVQYPPVPEVPSSYIGSQYGRDSYLQDRHFERRYSEDVRIDPSHNRYPPDRFQRRYTASEFRGW